MDSTVLTGTPALQINFSTFQKITKKPFFSVIYSYRLRTETMSLA